MGIAGVSPLVPQSIRARLNAVASRVRAGSVSIPTTRRHPQVNVPVTFLPSIDLPVKLPLLRPLLSVMRLPSTE